MPRTPHDSTPHSSSQAPGAHPEQSPSALYALVLQHRRRLAEPTAEERAARARATSILCHMSILCGFPIFLFMMFKRDDPLVLHHAKASAVCFALFYGTLFLSIVVEPALVWLALASYLPALIAVWRAASGRRAGWLGLGPVGEALFFPIQRRLALPADTSPSRALLNER